ncbi:hypothetical protein FQR65_LT14458 [Abscondita terminalis]|nr:hypothetical protein FQR65_LT14458 [Abscondita terminalis]
MASTSKSFYVNLQDAETNKIYSVLVTAEEAIRLENDNSFTNTGATKENSPTAGNWQIPEGDETGVFKWPHEAILFLMEEYRHRTSDFTTGKMSQKKVWACIAQKMCSSGYSVTGAQCLSKFSSLKRTYKSIKDHNNKSGNSTRTWPYFSLMDDLLHSLPFMKPLSTASSTGESDGVQDDTSNDESEEKSPSKKPRKMSSIDKMLDEFREARRESAEAFERRHQENRELRERLVGSFEKLLDVLIKK